MPSDALDALFGLQGRVALVTGGNGGIGLGMARGLLRAGADVVISGRDAAKGDEAVASLADFGGRVTFLRADLAEAADCRNLPDQAASRFGRLDILVNNAGMVVRKRPEQLTLDEWNQVMATNLSSAFLCAQASYPHMKAAGAGKIINIGSMLSLFGTAFGAAYGASKGGLVQLTRSLAAAWGPDNIQVNAVLPGWISTAMGETARREVDGLEARVTARTFARRWGQSADLEGIAVFLASDASNYITGTAIPADGGYAAAG
jgi:2-deoxy-D-gluconate 3-dehydrogenase